ncbi:MAG: PLP-dependent aminotransferase family protein [Gemmatimonadetes bacterium]|nr:PLP-dependent aminotransferase family protein [Gemmatimonadota bacterium]
MRPHDVSIPDILLPLDNTSATPLKRQVYLALRDAIQRGRLPPGSRVPATRRMAEYLAVSRTTVLAAFDQLVAEGFLIATVGSGSRVADHIPVSSPPGPAVSAGSVGPPAALSRSGRSVVALPRPDRRSSTGPHPFRTGQPPVDGFPLDVWRRLASRIHRSLTAADLYHGPAQGLARLREGIVTLALARGIRCDARQVLVVSSAQEAMELTCRMMLDPGDEAWLEDPAWLGAHAALLMAGARVAPVPVDEWGLLVDAGIAAAPRAKLAYVTPSHQYPTGVTMSVDRRRKLLEWARDHNAWIMEDDYDSEFRYTDRPLPALRSLTGADRVIYIGTFNKTLFPALRLAYIIVPDELLDAFVRARAIGGQHPPVLDQAVLSEFIAGGHYARHLTRVRALGRERRDALVSAATRSRILEFTHTDTGLHTVGWLPPGVNDLGVSDAALRHGIEVAPLSGYCLGPCPRPGLLMGYGSLTTRQIEEGVERLAAAIGEVSPSAPAS